jgi:hypothetical protein
MYRDTQHFFSLNTSTVSLLLVLSLRNQMKESSAKYLDMLECTMLNVGANTIYIPYFTCH